MTPCHCYSINFLAAQAARDACADDPMTTELIERHARSSRGVRDGYPSANQSFEQRYYGTIVTCMWRPVRFCK